MERLRESPRRCRTSLCHSRCPLAKRGRFDKGHHRPPPPAPGATGCTRPNPLPPTPEHRAQRAISSGSRRGGGQAAAKTHPEVSSRMHKEASDGRLQKGKSEATSLHGEAPRDGSSGTTKGRAPTFALITFASRKQPRAPG
jgi:hypothetical protein